MLNFTFSRKHIAYVLLGLVGVYGIYYGYNKFNSLPKYTKLEPTPVNTLEVNSRFLMRREMLPARLEAESYATLVSEVQGKVKQINISEGQFVKEGTLLVQLDDASAAAAYEGAVAEYDKTVNHVEKAKILVEKGDIPEQTLKDKEAELKVAESAKNRAYADLSKFRIFAPFDGIVGLRHVSVGTYVQPQVDIVRMTKMNPLRVKFAISADRLPYVIDGNKVQVFVGDDGLPVEGVILAHESALSDNTHMVDVVAKIDNASLSFLPGQHAKVGLITSKEDEVMAVSESALLKGENDTFFVFVVKQDIAVKTEVEIGSRRGDGYVEVKFGLNAGDEVIIDLGESKNIRISDGMPVKKITEETE